MRIGVIQAGSQTDKNNVLYETVLRNAKQHEVINFGCFCNEKEMYTYVDISIEIGLLIASGAIDFVVTGCSSGQGMMLACNSIPGVLCGYTPTPQDAFLFGRINNGNAVSVPLGLNYGWAGEINLNYIMEALFSTPFGTGYPLEEAERKRKDAVLLKRMKSHANVSFLPFLQSLDEEMICRNIRRDIVTDFILEKGKNIQIVEFVKEYKLHNALVYIAYMTDTAASMEKMWKTATDTENSIERLQNAMNEVSEFAQTIGSITSQTNLLALNASIEAARAGEHGKGFAVVAEEVRVLAENSKTASESIKGIIENIGELLEKVQVANGKNVISIEDGLSQITGAKHEAEQIGKMQTDSKEMAMQVLNACEETEKLAQTLGDTSERMQELVSNLREQTGHVVEQGRSQKIVSDKAESAFLRVEDVADRLEQAAIAEKRN